jgi:hypothetical protein
MIEITAKTSKQVNQAARYMERKKAQYPQN